MTTDFLVIGTGIAGLTFTLKVCKFGKVIVITKKSDVDSSTNYAQGGIAAVFDKRDSFKFHISDTLVAGDGLCNEKPLQTMVEEGPRLVSELMELGVDFSRVKTENNKERFDLAIEGGHSKRRIVHARDFTGREIETTLLSRVRSKKNVQVYEDCTACDLVVENNRCCGVYVLLGNRIEPIASKLTLLATGGCGRVYLHTTNPSIVTGDGIAMAYRAGGEIRNMEFIQFHPTSFYGKEIDDRKFLISEAVRGEGGVLRTKDGKTFMEKYHPLGCLAPRDIVARAIDTELKKMKGNYVYLDITHLDKERIKQRFPTIYETCLDLGVDITERPIPVVPAAHYVCGGVATDLDGRTTIEGLYAAGECAYTGVHGANRLASNSLLESLVFAEQAARDASKKIGKIERIKIAKIKNEGRKCDEEVIGQLVKEIRETMWDYVGIVRSNQRLKVAQRKIKDLKGKVEKLYESCEITHSLIELQNLATIAELITMCAIKRKESRGLHYNTDYPKKSNRFKKDTVVTTKV